MIPYATFLYFAVAALYIFVPVLCLRAIWPGSQRLKQGCIIVATLIMLALQYSGGIAETTPVLLRPIAAVGLFVICQYILARAVLFHRLRSKTKWPGYTAVAIAVVPLLLAKFLPENTATGASAAMPAGAVGARGLIEFMGLTYATLRVVDVLIGIQDGLIAKLSPGRFFAFLLFFPTVSSGPIDRFRRFSADWIKADTRADLWLDLDKAVHRIFTGFFYKFILAHLIAQKWMDKVPADPSLGHTVSYMYAYSLYLFFDFAGYSAFAVGFGHLLGIRVPENFDRPFLSRNIKEFWTRWHITLSFWFRDFIYMRFLLMAIRKKWFRSKHAPAYIANFLTFGIMGFWHGTATHYLIYGIYHACLITGHDVFAQWNRPRPDGPARFWGNSLAWQIAGAIVTVQAVCFGFLIFSGRRLW